MQDVPPAPFSRVSCHLRVVANGWPDVSGDDRTPERAAAEWFILLREEPEDAELHTKFEQWLAADPLHAQAWNEMQMTTEVIGQAPPERRTYRMPEPPRSRGTQRRGRMGVKRRLNWKSATATAAAACLAVLVAPTVTLRLTADHISGTGEVETVRLADGSTVRLGPDSAIAVDYSDNAREIRLLSGQAMFEVERDPDRPFRVAARDVRTTVLGTGFEVRTIGDATSVAVRHGRVRVEDLATDPISSRELTAGDWVRVSSGGSMMDGEAAPSLVGAWDTGKITIRNRPISEAIDEMRPWYGGKIILADSALGAKPVTGTYDAHDPERSLALIVAPYGGKVTHITPWLMIVDGKNR